MINISYSNFKEKHDPVNSNERCEGFDAQSNIRNFWSLIMYTEKPTFVLTSNIH